MDINRSWHIQDEALTNRAVEVALAGGHEQSEGSSNPIIKLSSTGTIMGLGSQSV